MYHVQFTGKHTKSTYLWYANNFQIALDNGISMSLYLKTAERMYYASRRNVYGRIRSSYWWLQLNDKNRSITFQLRIQIQTDNNRYRIMCVSPFKYWQTYIRYEYTQCDNINYFSLHSHQRCSCQSEWFIFRNARCINSIRRWRKCTLPIIIHIVEFIYCYSIYYDKQV